MNAKLSYLHIAPRKVRLVADMIRLMDADKAEFQLRFSRKRASEEILKLLHSARANAMHNSKIAEGTPLYIKSITVDSGPAYKRFHPQSRGRAARIKKFTSHVIIELAQRAEVKTKK